ncbi:MAG: hypothetical protein ABJ382_07625, partial [Ilumatobacter sp.]
VCLFSSAETDLTVDVVGYVSPNPGFESLDPARVFESRVGTDTVDGRFVGGGRIGAGETVEVELAGRGGVDADAAAVVMNVTAINPAERGFLTIFPCDSRPIASSLNYIGAGAVIGNEVIAKLSDAGTVCVYTFADTHLTIDVTGFVAT